MVAKGVAAKEVAVTVAAVMVTVGAVAAAVGVLDCVVAGAGEALVAANPEAKEMVVARQGVAVGEGIAVKRVGEGAGSRVEGRRVEG